MSIRQRFTYGNLEMKRYQPWRLPVPAVTFEAAETGQTAYRGFDDQREHSVSVRCYVTFWANSAQLPKARESAEQVLMDTLYRDLFAQLSVVEHLITCGDQMEALEAVLKIRKEFMSL